MIIRLTYCVHLHDVLGTMKPRIMGPDQEASVGIVDTRRLRGDNLLTEAGSNIGRSGCEGVIGARRGSRPDIRERALDQDQAWSTEEASVESAGCKASPGRTSTSAEEEQHRDEEADHIDGPTTKPFTPVRGKDGSTENAENIKGHAEDGDGHLDIELHHNLRDGDRVGGQAKCTRTGQSPSSQETRVSWRLTLKVQRTTKQPRRRASATKANPSGYPDHS